MHKRETSISVQTERFMHAIEKALRKHLRVKGQVLKKCELAQKNEHKFSTVCIFDVLSETSTLRFVAKITKDHPANTRILEQKNQSAVEYEALRRLYPLFCQVEGCSVPYPVAVLPELNTHLMEYVSGSLLADQLRYLRPLSSPRRFHSLCNGYFLTGRWLKHFQELSGIDDANSVVLDAMIERCSELFRQAEAVAGARLSSEVRGQTINALESARNQLKETPIPVADLHGDFGPWNVMMNESGVVVLDFFDLRRGPVLIDPLRMLVQLDDENHSLTTSRRRVDALRHAFLQGYGELPTVALPLLQFCETYQRAVSLMTCFLARKHRLHQAFEQSRIIKKQTDWLTGYRQSHSVWPNNAWQ